VSPALAGIAGALLLVSLIGPSAAVAGPRLEMLPPLMGEPYSVTVQPGDTLLDIAFEHRVGFEQLARLNPGVDIWLPEPGTPIEVPTRVAPPGAPPEGLVVNIPEMRLYDFTVPGEPGVNAIAIGDPEAQTPTGDFRLGLKRIFPTWHVPESIRQERPELPPAVPPGPENPLGDHWMTLGTSSYGIHGTNNRWSIGRMSTHGCIRLYGDVMRDLYDRVPEGTRVQIAAGPGPLRCGESGPRAPAHRGAARCAGSHRRGPAEAGERGSSYFLTVLLKIASLLRAASSALAAALAAFAAAASAIEVARSASLPAAAARCSAASALLSTREILASRASRRAFTSPTCPREAQLVAPRPISSTRAPIVEILVKAVSSVA
jgi:L,D-transpeptidase ErfK/SrfK